MEEEYEEGGRGKTILIILILLILVLAGGAFALRFFAPGLIPGWGEPASGSGSGVQAEKVLMPFEPFIVNLMDPGGKRYLKVTLSMELPSKAVGEEIEARMPQIKDAILVLLSSKTFDDISSMEGKERLKAEIISRTNAFLTTGQVGGVFFSGFVVQ